MAQNKRVMIIEDDDVVQKLIAKLVGRRGAVAVVASTSRDIRSLLEKEAAHFDLFLVDLILPDITGWEIMQLIRDNPATVSKPIIVLTGAGLSDAGKRKILMTAQALVEKKSFTLQQFESLLDQWL